MERNYDKVEQSNGGKNMRFFEYLKKQEPSKENEEARKRIYKPVSYTHLRAHET